MLAYSLTKSYERVNNKEVGVSIELNESVSTIPLSLRMSYRSLLFDGYTLEFHSVQTIIEIRMNSLILSKLTDNASSNYPIFFLIDVKKKTPIHPLFTDYGLPLYQDFPSNLLLEVTPIFKHLAI